jgi:dienelactone hydrolase
VRKDIEFSTEDGTILRGWHFTPASLSGSVPTIIMAHGFSAVKEMHLDRFAEIFCQAGMAALVSAVVEATGVAEMNLAVCLLAS